MNNLTDNLSFSSLGHKVAGGVGRVAVEDVVDRVVPTLSQGQLVYALHVLPPGRADSIGRGIRHFLLESNVIIISL